ncbi:hypothetical protein BV898_07147 [Hypsibius exemplaris]|uniref:Uncharacterized protein n=1 Tax=Hypsibius exemplaris TaxID=2072580 RepID=A0A1W0WU72_HYPEX|nr:hypothetical protein BV898_07147 [Hypsibius exemplaris]
MARKRTPKPEAGRWVFSFSISPFLLFFSFYLSTSTRLLLSFLAFLRRSAEALPREKEGFRRQRAHALHRSAHRRGPQSPASSLYVRPTFIGTEGTLQGGAAVRDNRPGRTGFRRQRAHARIAQLIDADRSLGPASSLYVRPTFIGTEGTLGVARSKEALLYVITGPVGPGL